MNRRRPQASIVANPVLVGAVTTLVVVVAVFLAYNANNGLPFVPTQQVKVHLANGANLVRGNEVRSGGFRLGVIQEMRPIRLPNGNAGAELDLKLDKKIGEIPVDSTVVVRPRSSLGLKYLEFHKGRSREVLPDGGTLPLRQSTIPVELDEFYNMFDEDTRAAARENLQGFGDAFSGRGTDLNQTIQDAPELFRYLRSVMANLSDPRTELENFFKELGDTARIIAPVSEVNARLFTEMADTFEAFSRDTDALKATISKSPPTLRDGTRSFAVQRPFLRHTAALSRDLKVATDELRPALPPLNRALEVGTPVTRRSSRLYEPLGEAMGALQRLAQAPTTAGALRGVTAAVTTLQPTLRYIGPYITVCNGWNQFWTVTAEHFTAPDNTGGSERALLNNGDSDPDNVTSMGANEFVHGEQGDDPDHNGGRPQHLHGNVWGSQALDFDGSANCQAGQAGYLYAANKFSPHGDHYKRAVVDTPTKADYPDAPVLGPNFKVFDKNGKGSGLTRRRPLPDQTWTNEPGGRGVNP